MLWSCGTTKMRYFPFLLIKGQLLLTFLRCIGPLPPNRMTDIKANADSMLESELRCLRCLITMNHCPPQEVPAQVMDDLDLTQHQCLHLYSLVPSQCNAKALELRSQKVRKCNSIFVVSHVCSILYSFFCVCTVLTYYCLNILQQTLYANLFNTAKLISQGNDVNVANFDAQPKSCIKYL